MGICTFMFKKIIPFIFFFNFIWGQNITLYQQFNGRFDFTFVGNTLNPSENSFQTSPSVFTTSSASLNLGTGDVIEKAYLYWAGCGTGDFSVKLNGTDVAASRTFANVLNQGSVFNFFSAFADVTSLVQSQGNGTYTVSDLDVSSFINFHFQNRTNFAGWAIVVVYKNTNLPLNQLNVYDGLQVVSQLQNNLDVPLNALNVIDNQNAKIGFIAWEGDSGLAVNETLRINGNIISNPPLNPANNAFNGTNSVTNSNTLYNMDLDIYGIQNNINIGDTSALIQLTSGQDYVMINTIVTKLNSQLPDATIQITDDTLTCNSRTISIDYEVFNTNCTNFLPAQTPITFYANGIAIGTTYTQNNIPIDGSETGTVNLTIPASVSLQFNLVAVVDDNGNNTGIVTEILENNNSFTYPITLLTSPLFNPLEDLVSCNLGFTRGLFDFSDYQNLVKVNATDIVAFYESESDANAASNPISNYTLYEALTTPKTIWIRLNNTTSCYAITSFTLQTKNCPPIVFNAVSPNNDELNETFYISGLRNIFLNFKLEIYNRWGKLIWTGDQNKPDWDGTIENGVGSDLAPGGTYFYILYLNDPDYPNAINGSLLLKR